MVFDGAGTVQKEPVYFAAVLSDSHVIEGLHHMDGYKYRVICKKEMSIPVERCQPVTEAEFYLLLDKRAKTIRHFIDVYRHYLARLGSHR